MKLRLLLLSLLGTLTLQAQENIEQYLLTDSLEIEALVDENTSPGGENDGPRVHAFTSLGIGSVQLNKLGDMNQSLVTHGYAEIPSSSLAWVFCLRVDAGDHFSLGQSIFSNLLFNDYKAGVTHSSKFSHLSYLIELGYRHQLNKLHLVPGFGIGFSQNYLSLKPNGRDELDWDDLFVDDELMVAIRQIDFSISTNLTLGKYIVKDEGKPHLLSLKMGLLFHPFSIMKPGVYTGEGTSLTLKNAPSLNSTGIHVFLTWD